MNFQVLTLLAVAFIGAQAEISGDMKSTAKIVALLCLNHPDDIAQRFFACYDNVPGRDQFITCQLAKIGVQLDSHDNVTKACFRLYRMGAYKDCLETEFTAAGIDLAASATAVNKCQAEVVGAK